METWIWALVMFALSIIPSILSNKKKKREAENAPFSSEEDSEESSVEESFFERSLETRGMPEVVSNQINPIEFVPEVFSYETEENTFTVLHEMKASVFSNEIKEPDEESLEVDDFDLKRAVIYQSILENKYL